MTRILSQALIARTTHSSSLLPNQILLSLNHRHTFAEGTVIEIDLETSSDTKESGPVRIVKLADLMHTIIAQRSAPSWLPFIPGSSYWVPPKPTPKNVANLLNKCAFGPTLSPEEALSLTSVRGWPSSFHLLRADTEVQLKVADVNSRDSDDEED
ncbi:hypothetical protein QQ045_023270 [Rhodiola kirilowii]